MYGGTPCQHLFSFYNSQSDRCEVIFHCGFDLISDVEYLFMYLLEKYLFKFLAQVLIIFAVI